MSVGHFFCACYKLSNHLIKYFMLNNLLPQKIAMALSKLKYQDLCEVRLRVGCPIMINYKNGYYFLGESGLCTESNSFFATKDMIKYVIGKASNCSIYSVNDEIKQGFITAAGGIRVGIVGEVVCENEKILTIKNFSSINIRVPHQINGAAYNIAKFVVDEEAKVVYNTIILGSPATGKTTILRDLCNQIYNKIKDCNILLLDERFEIASCVDGQPQLMVGNATDVISGGKKSTNILNGIRSMAPNVIAVDEIGCNDDIKAIEYAVNCGVGLVATIHSKNIYEFSKKAELQAIIRQKSFKRFVEISNNNGKGTVENIYDENFKPLLRFL